MTYDEIKKRLTEVETALQSMQNKKSAKLETSYTAKSIGILTTIKESLEKQLAEKDETMFISTKGGDTKAVAMDRKSAMDLKKDPNITGIDTAKGQKIKEQDGVKFSVEETKAIAKSVGKGLLKALKQAGDEVARIKAHRIEENSFDIHITYKGEKGQDEFSFYISDDSLHLVDFSFDKELVDVGVKPSGEAIVNVDVLANELLKHFKSLSEVKEGEGDDHHYIKVPRREYKAAMQILNRNAEPSFVKMDTVDDDGMGNVIIYFMFNEFADDFDVEEREAFMADAVMDLQAHGIDVQDHSAELDEAQSHPVMVQQRIAHAKKAKEKEKEKVKEGHGGDDLDVGHQDDEPGMLKSTSYEIATYAAKLYKKLAKYDQVDGEVDFPNWWQSKLILAKDYVAKAYHYLDSEEKQPIIDKLALEHALKESTDLYDRNGIQITRFSGGERGLMVQINYGGKYIVVPADEFAILSRAMQSVIGDIRDMTLQMPRKNYPKNEASSAKIQKAHGQVVAKMKELAKQYKAGDKSVVGQLKDLTAKKKELEKHLEKAVAGIGRNQELSEITEDEVQDGIYELRDLIDQIDEKAEEAREVVRQVFPDELSRLDSYGAFNMTYSNNRYDVTLGKFVERLEEEGFEIDDDGDVNTLEGKYKSDAQRKAIYAAKAEKNEAELNKKEKKDVKKIVKQLKKSVKGHGDQAKYLDKLSKESAPGYKHDCAAKVVHETYGEGICIPEKHTLIKEGNKYVVTHYDVLFKEGKKVVEDIPVEELKIVTQKEHWHKDYKKKNK